MASLSNASIPTTTTNPPVSHTVTVGKNNLHKFDPQVVQAKINDTIYWEFFPTNHSLIRGIYEQPCMPYESLVPNGNGAIWSGWEFVSTVMPDVNMPWFNYTVVSNETLYLYCGAPGSCNKQGMVMIVNPTSADEFSQYQKNALAAPYVVIPGQPLPDESVPSAVSSVSLSPTTPTTPTTSTTSTTPVTSTSTVSSKSSHSKISIGAIVGITLCGLTLLVLTAVLILLLKRRRMIRRSKEDHDRIASILQSTAPGGLSKNPYSYIQSPIAPLPPPPPATSPPPLRETIIIPMTEAEKIHYLQRFSDMSSPTSPNSGTGNTLIQQNRVPEIRSPYEM